MNAERDIAKLQRLRKQAIQAAGRTAKAAKAEAEIQRRMGEELRLQRLARRIRLRILALKLGVHPSTMTRIEQGSLPLRNEDFEIVSQLWKQSQA